MVTQEKSSFLLQMSALETCLKVRYAAYFLQVTSLIIYRMILCDVFLLYFLPKKGFFDYSRNFPLLCLFNVIPLVVSFRVLLLIYRHKHMYTLCYLGKDYYLFTSFLLIQRDTTGLSTENTELKLRLQAMEQQAQLRDGKCGTCLYFAF